MLEFLHIKNLALIEEMQLDFSDGMNVLTGETGAGKSFIIKAINFLLGEKLETKLIRPEAEKAEVQAIFIKDGEELIIKRELLASSGRSRFFLNGDLASQDSIKELRQSLILHASQHGQQKLLQASYQAALIDGYLTAKAKEVHADKDEILTKLKEISLYKKNLIQRIEDLRDKRELLESQQEIIKKVQPEHEEEEKLEALRQEMRSFEKYLQLQDKGIALLRSEPSLHSQCSALERIINQLTEADESFNDELESVQTFIQSLNDIEQRLRTVKFTPENEDIDLEEIEERLYELAQLKRKLRRSIPEILNLQEEIEENLNFLDTAELDLMQADKEEYALILKLQEALSTLNAARKVASEKFCTLLKEELNGLGFSEGLDILADIQPKQIWPSFKELNPSLEDIYSLLFAPNPGQPPQALDKIASGGELSRFLLAITSLQVHSDLSLLIFDEVDAGIGGNTLNKVAQRLDSLAQKQQMLLITHWPNLAAFANKHFFVEKEVIENKTYTKCFALTQKQIEKELERMKGNIKD